MGARCANCKFFKNGYFVHNDHSDPEQGCRIEKFSKADYGMCMNEKIGSDYKDGWLGTSTQIPPDDGVFACCDEDRGCLWVGKSFGCIHFEDSTFLTKL
jgi:hypothetical protein